MFYLELFDALERHRVKYLLVGGLALNIHGVERATMDVDLVLALDRENLDAFLSVASDLDLSPVAPVALDELKDEARRRSWVEEKGMIAFALRTPNPRTPTLDILIKSCLNFHSAWQRRLEKDLGSAKVSLASVEDLMDMKRQTGRQRDASDVAALERLMELRRKI